MPEDVDDVSNATISSPTEFEIIESGTEETESDPSVSVEEEPVQKAERKSKFPNRTSVAMAKASKQKTKVAMKKITGWFFNMTPYSTYVKKPSFVPPPLGHRTRFESETSRLSPGLKYLANTSEIFNRTLQWEDTSIAPGTTISKRPISKWFPEWKSRLRVNCTDSRDFSLCQVHAVVSWDSSSHTFRTYQIQPCPTLILFLSLDKDVKTSKDVDFTYCMVTSLLFIGSVMCRVDRLSYMPFLVERWKGHFSLTIIVSEYELPRVDSFLRNYASLPRFRVTLYIVLSNEPYNYVVFSRDENKKQQTSRRIFPINLLRDYALNNVVTSHVMLLDMDLWPTR